MGPISTNHSGCGIIWEGLVLSISNTEHCWQSSLGFYLHFCFSRFEICQWLTFSRWKSHGVSGPRFFFFFADPRENDFFSSQIYFHIFWEPSLTSQLYMIRVPSWFLSQFGNSHWFVWLVTVCFLHYPVSLTGSGWFCSVVSGTQ